MNHRAQPNEGITRRDLMGLGAGAAAFWGAATLTSCGPGRSKPRNVIFLVPDGMSSGVPAMAESFSRLVRQQGTHWHRLLEDRNTTHGLFDMASQNSLVTDSAAAATSWGSGRRVPNGMINQYPDGTLLTPLVPLLHDQGIATGLVTTARMTHATPAGFCANVPHRDYEDRIAADYARHFPHVLLGGGSYYFHPMWREDDDRDLVAEFAAKGYATVMDRSALKGVRGADRLLGLFAIDHLPYTLDHREDGALMSSTPTLAEMTESALGALGRHVGGFFLMVEGARVDHAAHANDAAGILWDQLAFDDAVGVALDFQKREPRTLIVVGSDHGNANPGLNGMGTGYRESTGCFQRLTRATSTASKLLERLREELRQKKSIENAEVARIIEEGTGYRLNERECGALIDALESKPLAEFHGQQANFFGLLGQMMANWNGVGWTGVTHTSDWTQTMALGPGQESFSGLLKNTDFNHRISEIFGITHRNPEDSHPAKIAVPEERAKADPTG